MKRLLSITLGFILLFITPVHAEKKQTDSSLENNYVFLNNIEHSVSYSNYMNRINGVYVNRITNTEYGIRRTISYVLSSAMNETYLTYIGDLYGNIISSSFVTNDGERLICTDLDNGIQNIVTYNSRELVLRCFKKQCTSYSYKVNAHLTDRGCSFYVGQNCSQFSPVATPIAAILCRAGVWVACHTSIDKICNSYATYEDICTL